MLREYGDYVRSTHPGSFTLGEVFDGSDAIFAYYPDQLDAFFAFGVSGGILDAVETGDGTAMLDAVGRMQNQVPNERWAPFLRNHDQTRTLTVLGGDLEGARLAATFLLTLPGLPFVYYCEELGMTGDKPDPRLRTPMHWDLGHAAGFTTGTPWEPLQDDWQTANVEVLEADEGSILELYKSLIRLRLENPALGASAELVPLRSNTHGAVAYLRRGEGDAALVVANLGTEPLADVDLWSDAETLTPGDYAPEILFGEGDAAPLAVRANGRLEGYVPLATLEPRRAYVLAVTSQP